VDSSGVSRKGKSLEQLKADGDREDKSLNPGEFEYCKYGGFANTKQGDGLLPRRARSMQVVVSSIPTDTCSCPWASTAFGAGGAGTPHCRPETYYAGQPPADLPAGTPGAAPRWETFYG